MPEMIQSNHSVMKRFVRKNLLRYMIPNVIFNTCIPYLTLKDLNAVQLFQGEYCFARFILPMALFLPFILTFDILKKTIKFSEQDEAGFILPDNFIKNRFMFKMAGINAAVSLSVTLIMMCLVQLNLPDDYGFNGTVLSIFLGITAAMFTLIFTFLPIKKIKNLYSFIK